MLNFDKDHRIIESMRHIHEITQLDLIRYDEHLNIIHQIQINPPPISIGFSTENHKSIEQLLINHNRGCYCYASTIHYLEYLFVPIFENDHYYGFIKVGPFLTTIIDDRLIMDTITKHNFPLRYRRTLEHYYDSLSLLSDSRADNIGFIMYNLINTPLTFVTPLTYGTKEMDQEIKPIEYDLSKENIYEVRYRLEKEVLHAIELGDKELYKKVTTAFSGKFRIKDRVPGNPLRSAKNLAFVFNTLSRIAAERGGLHPIHLHSLSEKYAILIEKATTRSEIDQINGKMPYDYIEAVHNLAYKDVGPMVRKIIHYIQLHLDNDLSPTSLAIKFNMSPSNLSNQFKKEMGLTVAHFVQEQRVKEACHHLRYSNLSIQTIASMVGYLDQNYFAKVFKSVIGETASTYRHNHQHN